MNSKKEHPPEENPGVARSFTGEELSAINSLFRGVGIRVDIESVHEGDILDICDLIAMRIANSGVNIGGELGRTLEKAQQVKKQMMEDVDKLIETTMPVLEDETLQDYLARNNSEKTRFPLEVRAAMAKLKLSRHIGQDKQFLEIDPEGDIGNTWLGLMEKLAALYEYCRQIAEIPQYRTDESKLLEAGQLSSQIIKELTDQGILFREADRDISDDEINPIFTSMNHGGRA